VLEGTFMLMMFRVDAVPPSHCCSTDIILLFMLA
jgi:hypothetical protein